MLLYPRPSPLHLTTMMRPITWQKMNTCRQFKKGWMVPGQVQLATMTSKRCGFAGNLCNKHRYIVPLPSIPHIEQVPAVFSKIRQILVLERFLIIPTYFFIFGSPSFLYSGLSQSTSDPGMPTVLTITLVSVMALGTMILNRGLMHLIEITCGRIPTHGNNLKWVELGPK